MTQNQPGISEEVNLREVAESDLSIFFHNQQDPQANYMAAFIFRDPNDQAAFETHWHKILSDPTTVNRTILFKGKVAGHVAKFEMEGKGEVTYWLGKEYWGQGIATRALGEFLKEIPERPLYAHAATDNIGSIRVLEKCGFKITGSGSPLT